MFVALGTLTWFNDDHSGGEPIARSGITVRDTKTAQLETAPRAAPDAVTSRGTSNALEMETSAGVTVVRPGAEAPNSVIIRVPEPAGTIKLAPAPDARLVERSRHGALPKVAADGARPFDVYARPLPANAKPGGRIAILIGGLGISQSATTDALARLPGAISFAFAPYGSELERSVARARQEGHEVFLQVPMEPFDYPDNDPGPHTLLTSATSITNIERLQWLMARFVGYVGIVNFTGGRFTADERALAPAMAEMTGRGLMIVDDGSSPRSLMLAGLGRNTPTAKADLVLDTDMRGDAIDKQLAKLETLARDKGVAFASASVLPATVERLARWSKTLEAKGLQLVPVSSLAGASNPATTGSIR